MNAAKSSLPSRSSILARLAVGLVSLTCILLALGLLAVWAMVSSGRQLAHAEQSFAQLENAQSIEAAFNTYLREEITRRLGGTGDPAESAQAAQLRAALLTYQRTIQSEIASSESDSAREQERAELIRAAALTDLFEAIETQSRLDRLASDVFEAASSAEGFLGTIVAGRDAQFRAVLFEIEEDERAEITEALNAVERIRRIVTIAGLLLGAVFAIGGLAFLVLVRRGLMRPIRNLSYVTRALGGGVRDARAPLDLPGEFQDLAVRFNEMADQIVDQQRNLEDQVTSRTQDLAVANAELTRIDETRRRFFANVSHELRTPVTVLLGEAQLALRGRIEPETMREALERINATGAFLRRRLDDLMKLARSEDGALSLTMVPASIIDPVRAAVDLASGYAKSNDVSLKLVSTDEAEIEISCDPEAMRQSVLALIDNAIKFSPPEGTVLIEVGIRDARVICSISDEGPGFDDPAAIAVFDRYAQESVGRQAGGSGLGLAIAKWIVEQHKGTIRASNQTGGGATLSMAIPI